MRKLSLARHEVIEQVLYVKRKRIVVEFGLPYFQHTRDRIRGIFEYANRNCLDWDFMTDPFDFFQAFKLDAFQPDQIDGAFVSTLSGNKKIEALIHAGVPVINLGLPNKTIPGLPVVSHDDEAIGKMAASHFDRPVISSTIYVGPAYKGSRLRSKGFEIGMRASRKARPHILIESDEMRAESGLKRLNEIKVFINKYRSKQPERLGVFAYSDSFAHAVIHACVDSQLISPNEVCVLGCDNDPLICSLSSIPLSSVQIDFCKEGEIAAEYMQQLMDKKSIPNITLVKPVSVVERLSSSHLAVEDNILARALEIIRDKACTGLRVYELLEYLPISRRSLESRFRATVGHSPHDEIINVRITQALALLKQDIETNAKIAYMCGFSSATHFEQVFRKYTGSTPSYYRDEKNRGGGRNKGKVGDSE